MKYLVKSLFIVLPMVFVVIIHLIFWYGNAFKQMFALVGGCFAAHGINEDYKKSQK